MEKVNLCLLGKEGGEGPLREQCMRRGVRVGPRGNCHLTSYQEGRGILVIGPAILSLQHWTFILIKIVSYWPWLGSSVG